MTIQAVKAPALQVSQWFNTTGPITLESLKGRVVLLHAFQMLCPACVSHGIPQAAAVHAAFGSSDVTVIGLHTVFEHHTVMTPQALHAFIHEYRIRFAVGVDEPADIGPIPETMRALQLNGTPSTVLIDRQGRVRLHHFGHLDDLQIGAAIGALRAECLRAQSDEMADSPSAAHPAGNGIACDNASCRLPDGLSSD